ncbi:MAG: hypothetical protein ACK56B_21045 [Dolichospermum sp.]|jgi:hypothetical protein
MLLNKNQIEAVRYQCKKLNSTCSNDEIRNSADKFKDFDAILIANEIINSRASELLIVPENQELETVVESTSTDSMLSLLEVAVPKSNTLTTAEKHDLIQIKSQELGISLNINEISKISEMVSDQVNDSINFLNEVGTIISEFFSTRNNQVQSIVDQKINDIAIIINTKNEQLGDIFSSANQRLIDIASDCNREKTDYKSTYRDKLESIREMLKLSA